MGNRQHLAERFNRQFTAAKRPNGEYFTKLREPYPEWMKEAIHAAHQAVDCDLLPNDWVYSACDEAAGTLADRDPDEWEDAAGEFADNAVEPYTEQLYLWSADHGAFRNLIEEAREELGPGESHEHEIQMGQYLAYERIYHAIREAIEEQAKGEGD